MEDLDLAELEKAYRQQVHLCQEMLEENSTDELIVKSHMTSRAAVSQLQRYTSGEESKDSKKKLLKSSLNNYTQSILDSTYYRECQLADAEFSDKASLEKVVGINQALSLPVQLCGSLERVVLLLGTELLECLYWRVGGLFYMYCHSFFEKEERRKNMDKEIFLKCCCAGVGYLRLMLSARTPLSKDEDYISHDTDMVQLLEQGIFSDIHMLAVMYAGELCYWVWTVSTSLPPALPPQLTPVPPPSQPKPVSSQTENDTNSKHEQQSVGKEVGTKESTREEGKRTDEVSTSTLKEAVAVKDEEVMINEGKPASAVEEEKVASTRESVITMEKEEVSKQQATISNIQTKSNGSSIPDATKATITSAQDKVAVASTQDKDQASDAQVIRSSERKGDTSHQAGSDEHVSSSDGNASKKVISGGCGSKVKGEDETWVSEKSRTHVDSACPDLYKIMRWTRGEDFTSRWIAEFDALKYGLEMLSKYINAARGPLKGHGWKYAKAVELVVKLKRAAASASTAK